MAKFVPGPPDYKYCTHEEQGFKNVITGSDYRIMPRPVRFCLFCGKELGIGKECPVIHYIKYVLKENI